MIDSFQLKSLVKKYLTNQTTILREYVQLSFLSTLYGLEGSQNVFFKGGTALRLVFGAKRFSEDLDFNVEMKEKEFEGLLKLTFKDFEKKEPVEFKQRKTVAGKKYLMTLNPKIVSYKLFISLDFSFREKAIKSERSSLATEYPVVFSSYVYHLSKEEILAEKVRAIMSRSAGRDIYDLWFLLSGGAKIDEALVKKKLAYYDLKYNKESLVKKITGFKTKDYVLDLRPFVEISQRGKLGEQFEYIKDFVATNI